MSDPVIFVTQRRNIKIAPISFDKMRELMHSAQLKLSAYYLRDGGILRQNGLCRMGMDPYNRPVLAYAADPDDFDVSPPSEMDHDIYHESLQGAQFLSRSSGYENFNRIYGIYARTERTESKWVIDQTRIFERNRRDDFFDYGVLCRVNEDTWLSKGVCYKRTPYMVKQNGGVIHASDEKGRPLYVVTCTTAPGKGWDLAHLLDPMLNSQAGRLMGFVSQKWRGVTDEEISPLIRRDMTKRVRRIMRGMDAYDLGNVPHYKPQTFTDHALRRLGRHIVKAIHASTFLNRNELTRLLLPFLLFTPFKKFAVVGAVLGKLVGHFLGKMRKDFDAQDPYNIIPEFWNEGVEVQNIPQQYERLSVDGLKHIRWLDAQEAKVKPDGEKLYDHIPLDFAGIYILGIFNGPPGVEMTHYRVGKQSVLLAKQPNGLMVEYWPQAQVAFAAKIDSLRVEHDGVQFDKIRPLPKSVQKLMRDCDVVMVQRMNNWSKTKETPSDRFQVKRITKSQYTSITRNLRRRVEKEPLKPEVDMSVLRKPDMRPSLCLRPVRCPSNPLIVSEWKRYEEQVPVSGRHSAAWRRWIGGDVAGDTAEEAVTEVGENMIVGAVRVVGTALKPK